MEELPLDPDTADRILSGQVAPDDSPPGYAALSALIRAAHQAPVGDELPGEEEAVEHMLASMAAPREWTAPPSRRSGRGMRMRAAVVATVTVVASTSGFAAAGALPRGAQSVVSKVLGSVGLDVPDPAETTELAATAETDAGSDDAPGDSLANRAERETTTTAAGAAVTSSSSSSTSSSSTTTTAAPAVSPTGDECGAITDTTVDGTTGDSSTTSSSSSSTSTSSSSTTSTTTTSSTTTTTQPEGSSTTTTASDGSTTTTTIATDPECADDAATEVTKEGTDDTVSSPSKASGNGEAKAAGRRKANDSSSTEGSATETSETSP